MARSLRVAFISEHASPLAIRGSVDAGGQNVYVDEVTRNLGALGHTVDIFTRCDAPDLPAVLPWAPGVRLVHLKAGPPRWIFKDDLWPLMPAFHTSLRHFIQNGSRYDLIHSNFWMSGWVGARLKEELNLPLVHIFHAMGKTKQRYQGSADTSPDVRILIEQHVIAAANSLIAQCPAEQLELQEDYGADEEKIRVIPSAVNTEIFRPISQVEARREIGLDPHELIVVYVGRMLPRKDIRNVVQATALLVRQTELPVRLLLVGGETPEPDPESTPEIGVLQRLADDLGIRDRVTFTGKRQPQDLHIYYGAGDIAVTTPWYEPFGLTPLEAMACGRSVIGSAVGGITYTIRHGVTGYLVPPRDPAALADRLHYLLTHDNERRQMGREARARVERFFTWPTVAERTAALYTSLCTEHAAASSTP